MLPTSACTLDAYLRENVDADERAAFNSRLMVVATESGLHRRMLISFDSEHRLTAQAWGDLVKFVLGAEPHFDSLAAAIREFAKCWVLKGGQIASVMPRFLGRAITRDELIENILRHPRNEAVPDSRRLNEIIDIALGADPNSIQELFDGWYLTRWAVWSTFNDINIAARPFEDWPRPLTPENVRGLLGLYREIIPGNRRKAILLLEYEIPCCCPVESHSSLCFPTVADATAGAFSYYFAPSRPDERYGRTVPWDEFANELSGRPEVVHCHLRGNDLIQIRELG